eukprot:gnl/MRDRNA2_/MRDRNA2_355696_c0_seq1.p1 gnl/MRDRNA2_/MRDRNA2_355696_c0~~gnl/MRDRNA2_/MRDRNA2_355696_c0_seq1.p1  ORF type:complete len:335 (-),score=61.08 gnl/MRDRNA2_/MRDRNA2_355696_c0_seq1:245-1123(-)
MEEMAEKWPLVANEARNAVAHLQNAYPHIVQDADAWTKLEIYTISDGWNDNACNSSFPVLCSVLRGKLRSESEAGRRWTEEGRLRGNDEVVGIFGVRAGGWVPLHHGQDIRVNVHLCLSDCNASWISVSGEDVPYTDGGWIAFEDRADHEIFNKGTGVRLNLVIGVLHPDFDPDRSNPEKHDLFVAWLMNNVKEESMPNPELLQAAFNAALQEEDVKAMEYLVNQGANVHALRDTWNWNEKVQMVEMRSFAVMEFLVSHGVDTSAIRVQGLQPMHAAAPHPFRDFGNKVKCL